MRAIRLLQGAALAAALLVWARAAHAIPAETAIEAARRNISDQRAGVASIRTSMVASGVAERSAAQRLADADILLRNNDFERAAIVFNEVIEKYPEQQAVYAEALYRLGDTYFQSKQYLSAKRVFERVVKESSGNSRLGAYRAKALARLADIALRTRDVVGLDELFTRLNQEPPSSMEPMLAYARGRVLIAKGDIEGARRSLQSVPSNAGTYHQAMYMLGVAALRDARAKAAPPASADGLPATPSPTTATAGTARKRGNYAATIEAFRAVTRLPPDTPDHKHVIDLAWMAIGRLLFESDQLTPAIEAYNHVDRRSPEFGTMLFELATVYVEMGDTHRAQRALEVLSIAEPDSTDAADAGLLRGDLQLRSGQFKNALQTFEGVRGRYDPMRVNVDSFLNSTSDPALYYEKLVEEQLDVVEGRSPLPPLAIRWAREADNGPEAFAVVDEVVQTRKLLRRAQDLSSRLTIVMNSPGRVRAFPELKAGEQAAISIVNALMRARVLIGQGLDDVESSNLSAEIGAVRQERRALQARVAELPVTPADFQQRDAATVSQWNRLSQKIQQLELQIDTLQAVINGLRRLLVDSSAGGVVRDPAATRRLEDELRANEQDMANFRKQTEALRRLVEGGRLTAGASDTGVFEDDSVRSRYKAAIAREVSLAMQGAAGDKAASWAARAKPLLDQAEETDAQIEAIRRDIAAKVDAKTRGVLEAILAEQAKVVEYAVQLDLLDQEARLVVGQVAQRNFGLVREKLTAVVLRADVGITEEAWEAREEQQTRVRNLQTERARSERLLNEELREVLDDAADE